MHCILQDTGTTCFAIAEGKNLCRNCFLVQYFFEGRKVKGLLTTSMTVVGFLAFCPFMPKRNMEIMSEGKHIHFLSMICIFPFESICLSPFFLFI